LQVLPFLSYEVSAFNILLITFKTFKYLKVNKRLYVLWQTLDNARTDLLTFIAIFAIILLGFLFMGWLTFGAELGIFNGFISSMGTCWQFLIGNPPDFFDLYYVNRALGPIFFTLFTVFVFFILANMFIAIISGAYAESHTESQGTSLSIKAVSKPIASMFSTVKYTVQHKQRILSETQMLAAIHKLPDGSDLSSDTLRQVLVDNGLPPYKEYITRLKNILIQRNKIEKKMLDEKRQAALENLEDDEFALQDPTKKNSLMRKSMNTNVEMSNLSTMRSKKSENTVLAEKLDLIMKRLDEIEKELQQQSQQSQPRQTESKIGRRPQRTTWVDEKDDQKEEEKD